MALRTSYHYLAILIFEVGWRDGIEVRFKAFISGEGLCLHDVIERLITVVFLTGIELLIFLSY